MKKLGILVLAMSLVGCMPVKVEEDELIQDAMIEETDNGEDGLDEEGTEELEEESEEE